MKKVGLVAVFIFGIVSLNSCRSTNSCSSVEKQKLKSNVSIVSSSIEANT